MRSVQVDDRLEVGLVEIAEPEVEALAKELLAGEFAGKAVMTIADGAIR